MKIIIPVLMIFILCGFFAVAEDLAPVPADSIVSESPSDISSPDAFYVALEDVSVNSDGTVSAPQLVLESNSSESTIDVQPISDNSSAVINSSENESPVEDSNSGSTEDDHYSYVDLGSIIPSPEVETPVANDTPSKDDEIAYVLYDGHKKEIETMTTENAGLVIDVDEMVLHDEDWKKEVTISSNKHHTNPVTLYTDILEDSNYDDIHVFWKEEGRDLDYEKIDTNGNSIPDRISWVVPHLSEQNFEITLGTKDVNSTGQITITSPSFASNVTSPTVLLSFLVNSTESSSPSCNITLMKSGTAVNSSVFSSTSIQYNASVDNGAYIWNLNCTDNGVSNQSIGTFSVSLASNAPKVTFTSSAAQVVKNNPLNFTVNITSTQSPIQYILDWGDGSSIVNPGAVNNYSLYQNLSHTYSSTGSFSATLTAFIGGSSYERKANITVITLGSTVDNSDPNINLIYPSDGEDVEGSLANLSYTVTDNVFVANCTLSMYYYQDNNPLGVLIYSQLNTSVNNSTLIAYVHDLESGDYSWDVGCYDNSSNYDERNRDFRIVESNVSGTNYATYTENELNLSAADQITVDDIDALVDKINQFITREDSYGKEEKQAIEDLGLDDKITGYKKLLLQNKLDITYNLGFMRDDALRQSRKDEIRNSLDQMEEDIPIGISVTHSYDYYKTESQAEIQNIISEIIELRNVSANEASIAAMTEYLQQLQSGAVISSNAKQVTIEYEGSSDDITLVSKSIEMKNDSFDSYIERIPSDVSTSQIVFMTKSKSLGNQYYEIQPADVVDSKIVYYIKDSVELKSIEQTSTVLFDDGALTVKSLAGITGFVTSLGGIGVGGIWPYALGFIFITMLLFGGAYYTKQMTIMRGASQDEGFKVVKAKIESANRLIELKDFESAKSEYRAIKERYSMLAPESKSAAYKGIQKLQIELDRKEAIELVKEFITNIQQGRKDDARLIYNKIKAVYPRLPESDRKKGYDKIAPYVSLLNSP